jgi:hypothetical protein
MTRIAILIAGLITAGTAFAQPVTPPPELLSQETPEWFASARAFVPPDRVAGQAFHVDMSDPQAPVGYVAIYPAGANDPKTPASAFDAGEMLVAKLARSDGKLTALSAELRSRDVTLNSNIPRVLSAAHDDAEYRQLHAELLKTRGTLPDGAIPCDIHGWSTDRDPNGLNVRAGPSTKAKVLGTLPPPYKFKSKGENAPDGGWLTEFSIIGFKDGWFLIEGATPPGKDTRTRASIRAIIQSLMAAAAGSRPARSARNMPMATRGWADCSRRRMWTRNGHRPKAKVAARSAPTAAPSAFSPAAASGRWWKATTASAAGGDGCARAR